MRNFLFLIVLINSYCFSQDYENLGTYLNEIESMRKSNCDSALVMLQEIDLKNLAVTDQYKPQILKQQGLTHYCLGNFDESLSYYQKAIELSINISNVSEEISILNLIGTLHKKQDRMPKALEYFERGLQRAEDEGDSLSMGNSLNNIGLVHLQTDNIEKSLDYFLKSTIIKELVRDTLGLSYNYDNLGQVHATLSQYDKAINYFDLAAKYKRIVGDQVGYAIVQNNIGEMLLAIDRPQDAEPYFIIALDVATEVNYSDFRQHVLNMLSKTFEKKGQNEKAFQYYKAHVVLKDSLFSVRKSQQIAELEAKYETEKNKRKIESQQASLDQNQLLLAGSSVAILLLIFIGILGKNRLKWKTQKLLEEEKRKTREAEMNAIISSQEKERSRFARDLHDGFGQLISTLNLNLKNLKNPKDQNERELVFDASVEVLEVMYQELKNICFDLMPQTLIKHGLGPAIIEFSNRINLTGQKHMDVNIFGLEKRLSELQEISLYRITQEWVNNVIKYSDADLITIQITKDTKEVTLLIEDNGIGFDKTILQESKGNGWKNMTSRSNLIHGELELDTSPNMKGSSLILNAELMVNKKVDLELA